MPGNLKLTASDGFTFNAYQAKPEGKARGGVVVIGEVWGINNWVRSVADRFARHGYLAVAPAMFDRMEMGYESENYAPEQFQMIGELMKKFDPAKALLDIEAAVKAASAGGKVGITGYCFGGMLTWRAAPCRARALRPARAITAAACPTISISSRRCRSRCTMATRTPASRSSRSRRCRRATPMSASTPITAQPRLLQLRPRRAFRRSRLHQGQRPHAGVLPQAPWREDAEPPLQLGAWLRRRARATPLSAKKAMLAALLIDAEADRLAGAGAMCWRFAPGWRRGPRRWRCCSSLWRCATAGRGW